MNRNTIRPMLACSQSLTLEDLPNLTYPKWVSVKLDGIRCRTGLADKQGYSPGDIVGYSRTLKLIPNIQVQECMQQLCVGLDGEIIIPGADFHTVQSKVMTSISLPFRFEYHVFDALPDTADQTYLQRLQKLRHRVMMYCDAPQIKILPVKEVKNAQELWYEFQQTITFNKAEGLIVRSPDSPYKQGRSTRKEEYMLKMKQYEDREAIIIDFIEEEENINPKKKNEVGYTKRSSHQANKVGKERLGALVVRDLESGPEFKIGSGFDAKMRNWIWSERIALKGRIITYKSHTFGVKDKPREPVFKGIRYD